MTVEAAVEALSPLEVPCPPPVTFLHRWWHSMATQAHFFWRLRANQIFFLALAVMAFFTAGGFPGMRSFSGVLLFAGVTLFGIGFIFLLTILLFAISYTPSRNRSILTTHTITLTQRGVIEETSVNRNEIYWAGVDRVSSGRVFVYLCPSQFATHTIPRSAFESQAACNTFVAFAEHQIAVARTREAAV